MNWKKKDYVRKRFKMPCPICEYWLDVTVLLKHKEGGDSNEISKKSRSKS